MSDKPTDKFPSFDGTVEALIHRGNTIYVGGDFLSATDSTGAVVRHHAAAVDATTGRILPWNPRVSGVVYALAVRKEGVYLAGEFNRVRGHRRPNVALVSRDVGGVERGFNPHANGRVEALSFSRNTVYFGGRFTQVDGKYRNHLAATRRGGSYGLRRWSPDAVGGQVSDLVRHGHGLYVGGAFTTLNGSAAHRFLGKVNTRTGSLARSFNPDPSRPALGLHVTRTRVYAALGGGGGGGVLSVRRAHGDHVFYRRLDGDAEAVTVMQHQVYIGGHFLHVCATSPGSKCRGTGAQLRRKGASFDERGRLTGWNPGFDSPLGVVALDRYNAQDRLLVGGHFTHASRSDVLHFAVFD